MDIGSTHGTFLGREKLSPRVPREWRPGTVVFFADRDTESFKLQPGRARSGLSPAARAVLAAAPTPAVTTAPLAVQPTPGRPRGIAMVVAGALATGGSRRGCPRAGGTAPSASAASASSAAEGGSAALGAGGRGPVSAAEAPPAAPGGQGPAAEALYPGDWRVPADGLSGLLGWDAARAAAARGAPAPAAAERPAAAEAAEGAAGAGGLRALAAAREEEARVVLQEQVRLLEELEEQRKREEERAQAQAAQQRRGTFQHTVTEGVQKHQGIGCQQERLGSDRAGVRQRAVQDDEKIIDASQKAPVGVTQWFQSADEVSCGYLERSKDSVDHVALDI
ncbi:unnamed protein product [Prorocentrum cordatum]|uniref:FHA domain-containing protein n=1 Tax=Prorocentrum cordatum TaxID=2364126 RepID=A0ABN9QLS0_9DINO|nr:unnamed protein product [Polarella glacialis]